MILIMIVSANSTTKAVRSRDGDHRTARVIVVTLVTKSVYSSSNSFENVVEYRVAADELSQQKPPRSLDKGSVCSKETLRVEACAVRIPTMANTDLCKPSHSPVSLSFAG